MKKLCIACDEKPAKRLRTLPGQYANEVFFCSMKCAAIEALVKYMARCTFHCPDHGWADDGVCYDCEDEE